MKKKKINIYTFSEIMGVSISTISKALNDSREISDATKKRIIEGAKTHNYRPNFNATNLKKKHNKVIGVIIPDLSNYMFVQILQGIESTADKYGYRILTCFTNESYNKEQRAIKMLSNGSIDGFLVSISEETILKKDYAHLNELEEIEIPWVNFDRTVEEIKTDKIAIDHYKAGFEATAHMIDKGLKKIGFISTRYCLCKNKQRYNGYLDALKKFDIAPNKNIVIHKNVSDYKQNSSIIAPIFEKNIDSIIATNEPVAIAAMKIAQDKNLLVPDDFSVISFSNGILARHSNPQLSTMTQHGELMGKRATEMLINRIKEENTTVNTDFIEETIEGEIVERDSTKK